MESGESVEGEVPVVGTGVLEYEITVHNEVAEKKPGVELGNRPTT